MSLEEALFRLERSTHRSGPHATDGNRPSIRSSRTTHRRIRSFPTLTRTAGGAFWRDLDYIIDRFSISAVSRKRTAPGPNAKRTAEIARLTYLAAVRDVTAQAETAYYQIQLDLALNDLIAENVDNLQRVLKVTQIAYTANLATQGDFINAKFALEADSRTTAPATGSHHRQRQNHAEYSARPAPRRACCKSIANFDLASFETTLDQAIDRAISSRQEILQAALTEQNQDTAVTLAQLEYAPDYKVGFGLDHWLIASFAPKPNHTETWNFRSASTCRFSFGPRTRTSSGRTRTLTRPEKTCTRFASRPPARVTTALSPDLALARNRAAVSQHSDSSGPSGIRK